jgi:hypothetical protein
MSKDYERTVQTSETRIGVAMIRLLVTRLACKNEAVPKHSIMKPEHYHLP